MSALLQDRLSESVARNAWNWLLRQEYIIKAVSKINRSPPSSAPEGWTKLNIVAWDAPEVVPFHRLLMLSKDSFKHTSLVILSRLTGITSIPEIPWDHQTKEILVRTLDDVVPFPLPTVVNRFKGTSTMKSLTESRPPMSSQETQSWVSWEEAFIQGGSNALKMVFPIVFSTETILINLNAPITSQDIDGSYKNNNTTITPNQADIDNFKNFIKAYNSPLSIDASSPETQIFFPAQTLVSDRNLAEQKAKESFAQNLLQSELETAKQLLIDTTRKGSIFTLLWRQSTLFQKLFSGAHQHSPLMDTSSLYLWDRQPITRWKNDTDKFVKTFIRWLFALIGVSVYWRNEIHPNADLLDEWPDATISSSRKSLFLIWKNGRWTWMIPKKLKPLARRNLTDIWSEVAELIYGSPSAPAIKDAKQFDRTWLKNFQFLGLPRAPHLPTAISRLYLTFVDDRAPDFPFVEVLDRLYLDRGSEVVNLIPLRASVDNITERPRWDVPAKWFLVDVMLLASFDVYFSRKGIFQGTTPVYLSGEPLDLALPNSLSLIRFPSTADKYKQIADNLIDHPLFARFWLNLFPKPTSKIEPTTIDVVIKSILFVHPIPTSPLSRYQQRNPQQ